MEYFEKGKVTCIENYYQLYNIDKEYTMIILENGKFHVSYDSVHSCGFTKEELVKHFKGDFITILLRKDKLKKLKDNESNINNRK